MNAATRIGRPDLGLIAPGKRADVVILEDVEGVVAKAVVANGGLVSEGRHLKTAPSAIKPPAALTDSINLREILAEDFEIGASAASVRIATLSKPRFPEWGERVVPTRDGKLVLSDDMIRMAVINRYGRNTPVRVAFLENWGTWRGAFATTVSHDSHNVTVFGRDPEDMAVAANALRAAGGGLCAVAGRKVVAQVELPLGGLASDAPLDQVASDFAIVRDAMNKLVDWEPPYLVLKALFGASLVCNAGPRLSDVGIVDVFAERLLETPVL